jgi:hypothetical protein
MEPAIQPMSMDDYAKLQSDFGAKVVMRHGCYWRQVRPFFFRPLLPLEECQRRPAAPSFAWPCGHQHAVPDGEPSNSTMNFVVAENRLGFSLADLNHNRRRQVKQVARKFQVRRLRDLGELQDQGYRAYLSFYQRTGYSYKEDRKNLESYRKWASALFHHPKAILLGGYGADGLVAVLSMYWVNHILICATLFCETAAMQENVGELMLHELRQLAGQHPGISQIYLRTYQGGNSLDRYYLHRGCELVRKPAWLELPTAARVLLSWSMPGKYALLCGRQ